MLYLIYYGGFVDGTEKKVALACTVCGSRNYTIDANPNRTDRLEVKKFCKYCGKHTLHRETR
ncbi:50S ribosomal protein L33 [Lactiplantibacillus plantarum WHE 92]|nr:50S ribosomal protein L33 [Lactiplantibacillus plantarum WHE 92]